MTMPAEQVEVVCRECATIFTTHRRPSINLDIEPPTADQTAEEPTAVCPVCGHRAEAEGHLERRA